MGRWPFVTGFDWAGLDSDPPPGPWVRSWRWVAELRDRRDGATFMRYVAELQAREIGPDFGFRPLSAPSVRRLPVPHDLVLEEFAAQSVVFAWGGRRYRLAPSLLPAVRPGPLQDAVGLISLTTAEGRRPAPRKALTVGALDAQGRWTDRMIVVEQTRAVDEAAQHGQPAFLLWRPGTGHGVLEIVDTATGAVQASAHALLTRAIRPCPMIRGAAPGQLCRVYGGPWVSRAIVACGRWQREREVRLSDVGCDTCGDGRIRVGPMQDGVLLLLAPYRDPGEPVDHDTDSPTRYSEVVVRRAASRWAGRD